MGFEKVEFEFPHETEDKIEVEETNAVEIDLSGKKTEEEYAKDLEPEPEAVGRR
jgi:hypothetical protein